MIDISHSPKASPQTHEVPADPGSHWVKDSAWVVDAPPDSDINPLPEAKWPSQAVRTGVCGAVSPRVIALPAGGYRMFYTQILSRPGFPAGANDYENSTARILSARSSDGSIWTPEPGVRLSPREGGAGALRVVSSEVVPILAGSGRLRMYYERCCGAHSETNSICSAISEDGGLAWTPEPGPRLETQGSNYASPRVVFLAEGSCRLYCCERGKGIVSALSEDGGLTFRIEPGVRIAPGRTYDALVAFASEIMRVHGAGYIMYYAGYSAPNRSYILRAVSEDGLAWEKDTEPVISPGPGGWDAAKCSEMCVFRLPSLQGATPRYRMVYEACDGTAKDERGVWRIASATSLG